MLKKLHDDAKHHRRTNSAGNPLISQSASPFSVAYNDTTSSASSNPTKISTTTKPSPLVRKVLFEPPFIMPSHLLDTKINDASSVHSDPVKTYSRTYNIAAHGEGYSPMIRDISTIDPIPPNIHIASITDYNLSPVTSASTSPIFTVDTTNESFFDAENTNYIITQMSSQFTIDEEQQKLLNSLKKQLERNLYFFKNSMNIDFSTKSDALETIATESFIKVTPSELHKLGVTYKKLARVHDLLKNYTEAQKNEEKALIYFSNAIKILTEHSNKHFSETSNIELATYHASKAQLLYNKGLLAEAESHCTQSIIYNQNAKAYDCMGYVLRSQGKYHEALKAFERSLKIDPQYNKAHSITSLYNQSITLAALGRQEEALFRFELANNKISEMLDFDEKIFVLEMRKPNIENLLRKLSSIAITTFTEEERSPSASTTDSFSYYSKKPSILDPEEYKPLQLERANSSIELVAIGSNHHNDYKPQTTLPQFTTENIEEGEKVTTKSNDIFYTTIVKRLTATYTASQTIYSTLVENQKKGTAGTIAKWITTSKPTLLTDPIGYTTLTAIASILEKIDDSKQKQCIERFYFFTENAEEMQKLAEKIAANLTESLHKSSKIEAKSSATNDALEICNNIEKMIFDGRITALDFDAKINMIVALIEIEQEHNNRTIFKHNAELPKHTIALANDALEKIKNKSMPATWKNKTALEKRFVDYLAHSINDAQIPENIDSEIFSTTLVNNLYNSNVDIKNRTSIPWGKKATLSETFLSNKDYFNENVIATRSRIIQAAKNCSEASNSSDSEIETDIPTLLPEDIVLLTGAEAEDSLILS